jgi:hypothetical protein
MAQDPFAADAINPYASPVHPDRMGHEPAPEASFGRILNAGLRLFTGNLWQIAVVTLVVWTPLEIFQGYMEYFVFEADDLSSTFRLQRTLDNLFGIIATGGVIAIETAAMRGVKMTVWGGLIAGVTSWPRLFWTRLIRGLLLLLAFLALIIPGIYFAIRLVFVEPVAVIEHWSGGNCIKRAYELTAGRFWLLFWLLVLSYSAIVFISFALFIPLAFFPEIDHWLVSTAISLVVDVLSQIPTSILVAAYFACLHNSAAESQAKLIATPY